TWLAYRLNQKAAKGDDEKAEDESASTHANKNDSAITPDKDDKTYPLVIVNLSNKRSHTITDVFNYSISATNQQLLVSQSY
ncbi:hypothetical protein, partial [Pseudoalteromonas sp. GW168-MNA-CIBAN-0100]